MKISNFSASRRALLAGSASAFLLPKVLHAATPGYGITGQVAPELEVPIWIDGEGNPARFQLSEQRGKFVFLELWQSWCPGCHSHGFPTLQKIVAEFKDSPYFMPVGIQTTFEGYLINTEDKLRTMQKRYNLSIVMGHDAGDSATGRRPNTMSSYRSGGTPWAILISPDGRVLYNDFGIDAGAAIDYLREEIERLSA